jgi:hypothetical protein
MIDMIACRAHSNHERLDYASYKPNGQNLCWGLFGKGLIFGRLVGWSF